MKISVKIFAIAGLIAFFSSCQKENLPSPSGCPAHEQKAGNARIGDDSNSGGSVFNGEVGDEVASDSLGIVGGGDDDRDGGGIVGGGDADRDGGRRANPTDGPKK